MKHWRGATVLLASWTLAATAQAAEKPNTRVGLPLLTRSAKPEEFGIADDTIRLVSATEFALYTSFVQYGISPANFGLSGDLNTDSHFYANLDLPAGAVIDYIGLNSKSDTDSVIGVALYFRNHLGAVTLLTGFSAPAHDWDTDLSGPLGFQITSHQNHEYIIDVEIAPNPNIQYVGWVEVWWHRTVSSSSTVTFNDVPVSDPAFQFVEALAASGITGGCGGGNFCPDNPVTRRQMAVFLSKALGLHWPL